MEIIKIEPSDVLVVRTQSVLSAHDREQHKAHLTRCFGGGRGVLFIDGGDSLDVLRVTPQPAAELTVKVDAQDARELIAKAIGPGAVLLSPEAVLKLADATGIELVHLLDAGGVEGTAEAVGPELEPHVWMLRSLLEVDQIPYGTRPDGQVAVRVCDLSDAQRAMSGTAAQLAKLNG